MMPSTATLFLLLIVVLVVLQVDGYGSGAPLSTCPHGNAIHRSKHSNYTEFYSPQPAETNPFVFRSEFDEYSPGKSNRVSISGQNGELFRGFFLQARIINTSTPVGVFSDLPALTKIVSCSGTSDDSVTHTSSDDKEALSFVWTAPNRCVGSISFIGSVALHHSTFYVNMTSSALECNAAAIIRVNLYVLVIAYISTRLIGKVH
ncbi:putative defense protein 3 isoform X1 [Lytechinus variegatus]|uniref:putative defense protein 3 isoform X1 n=1 Tax=Lytechinus variegatus TaxID=7654 RepID=UPI001BB166C9|nr:putative defense protein 3 isoform X1 [Lytechinus variegatus]